MCHCNWNSFMFYSVFCGFQSTEHTFRNVCLCTVLQGSSLPYHTSLNEHHRASTELAHRSQPQKFRAEHLQKQSEYGEVLVISFPNVRALFFLQSFCSPTPMVLLSAFSAYGWLLIFQAHCSSPGISLSSLPPQMLPLFLLLQETH